MRIGVDIRCLMDKYYSGISEFTYNLLQHLFKIDSQNQYLLFYNSAQQSKVPDFPFTNVSFKEFTYPNKLFNLSMRFLKLTEVDKLIGGVDLFLIPSFLFLNLSVDCKKLLIVHDLSFELYPEFFTPKRRLWHKLIGPKEFCRQADKIVAISENTKNDIVNLYGTDPEKIAVVYQGINDIFSQKVSGEQKETVKKKYQLPERYVFYLGNLEPRKNIKSLILAFEKLTNPSVHLVIAGYQAWKYQDIYQLWQKSKAKDRIKFLGYVNALDKPALYSLAKVFVYPSIYEGFGLPPVEAMACGTPVITSFNSSLPEAAGTAGLMIDPYNINDLAQVITQVLTDQALAQELSRRGLDHSQKFNGAKQAEKFLAIINSLS